MKEKIKESFYRIFGKERPYSLVTTPGRANLIGEHIDYQGGYVLPIAVNRYIYSVGRKRDDTKIRLFSYNYDESFEIEADYISYQNNRLWANYALGVIKEFIKLGYPATGIEVAFGGDIPAGSGLSSSAALEISIAQLFSRLNGIDIPPLELIKLARRAENEFVGVNCGIMDQFSVHLAKADNALLLDCKTLDYRDIPLQTGENVFLLADTKKERKLSSSVYNDRVNSVNESLRIIRQFEKVDFLTEIKDINIYKEWLTETDFKRARHITEENLRVLSSVKYLEEGLLEDFGKAMYASHVSLRDLYQVSCKELDFIVDFSKDYRGCLGARLTGAGMGGSSIILLKKDTLADFETKLGSAYKNRFGFPPDFYRIKAVHGSFYRNN